jgi:hypothetical protein
VPIVEPISFTPLLIRSATQNADSRTNPSVVVIAVKKERHKVAVAVVAVAAAAVVAVEVDMAAVADDPIAKCTKPPAPTVVPIQPYRSNQRQVGPYFAAIAFEQVATSSFATQHKQPELGSVHCDRSHTRTAPKARPLRYAPACRPRVLACVCAAAIVASMTGSASAISVDLLAIIPRDHLAYVASDNSADQTDPGSPDAGPPLITVGADLLHRFGGQNVNKSAVGAVLDVLDSLAKLEPYPFAIVVTDASAKRLGVDSFRLSDLQAAVIVLTNGNNALITQHLQDLLTRWTSRDSARITSSDEYGSKVFTLVDDRLPDWCVVKWGSIKGCYVVSIGHRGFNDAAQSILHADKHAAEEIKQKRWQDLVDARFAHFALQVNFDAIRNALAPVMKGRTQNVLDELGFADCGRSMWTVSRKNRAVICTHLKIVNGQELLVPVSTEAHGVQNRLIPGAATEYTLFRCGLDDVLIRATNAYLASRRQEVRDILRSHWTAFETKAGISIQRDLFNQLGEIILIHDDPPHPLKLPLLSTVVIPIAGEPATVDRTLAALLDQTNRWQSNRGLHNANADPGDNVPTFAPQFTKADDNVWYLSFGFAGPAITVADRFIIISHSPLACRQARDKLLASVASMSESNGK